MPDQVALSSSGFASSLSTGVISTSTAFERPKSALKDALTRYIRWIAVRKEGIVACTRIGAYIAAQFNEARTPGRQGAAKLGIDTPQPDSTLECIGWFPDPRSLVEGRRDFLGHAAER